MVRALQIEPMTDTRKLEQIGGKSTSVYYTYWTNFNKYAPENFSVVPDKALSNGTNLLGTRNTHWWKFKTNIEPAAFEYEWDDKRQRRFLFAMYDIYNRRKVRA